MQILQWLFKVAQDQKPTKDHHHKEDKSSKKEEEKSKEIVCHKEKRAVRKARKAEETGLDCRNFRYLALLLRSRGKSRAYFYSTLNQKTLNSLNHRQGQHYIRSMKMRREDLLGNNKILPIGDDQKQRRPWDQKKSRVKGDQNNNKTKNSSRMKELLRWAAASKSEKARKFGRKGLHLRDRSATINSRGFDEEVSNDSKSNISLGWEVEGHHSTTCSAYDHECARKTGHWITTDDEFVVLEF